MLQNGTAKLRRLEGAVNRLTTLTVIACIKNLNTLM